MNLEEFDELRDIKAELKDIILELYIEKHTIDCDKKEDTARMNLLKNWQIYLVMQYLLI